jgi:hypothetical protein
MSSKRKRQDLDQEVAPASPAPSIEHEQARQASLTLDERSLNVAIAGAIDASLAMDRIQLGVDELRLALPGLMVRIALHRTHEHRTHER